MSPRAGQKSLIVFVCQHGSAKSLIAAEHLARLARARGLPVRGESLGVEPDAEVPPHVVDGLAADGFDVHTYVPRQVTAAELAAAARVVSFGCDLESLAPHQTAIDRWDDMPMVSDGYVPERAAIVARVEALLDDLS